MSQAVRCKSSILISPQEKMTMISKKNKKTGKTNKGGIGHRLLQLSIVLNSVLLLMTFVVPGVSALLG